MMADYPATFELPTKDRMTGLITSAYFSYLLREQLLPATAAEHETLSFFLTDIDGFLQVNQQQGRDAGDKLLTDFASLLRETLPESAVLSRWSGDEFAGALPGIRTDDAFTMLEELRRRAATQFKDSGITCSVGLASVPTDATNEVELIREADQALYVAKNSGRNKISLPLRDTRMITKTSHYTATQLERLSELAQKLGRNEASILREALDDVLKKHNDRFEVASR